MSTRYGCRFVTVLPHGRFTRLDRKGKLSNFAEKFQIANRVLISKKPWMCMRHSFLQRTSHEHRGQLENRSNQVFKANGHPIPSCQFSIRCGRSSFCLYHMWYSKPLNGFIGYGLCADDADAFTRGANMKQKRRVTRSGFFPGGPS
jgi:hypothetical protein